MPAISRLVRSRDFRTELSKVPGFESTQAVVIALPDDTMGYVFERLSESGGVGTIALVDEGRVVGMVVLYPASQARIEVAVEDDARWRIHDDTKVDFFLQGLREAHKDVVVSRTGSTARLIETVTA
jgi:hypothetical protein